MLNPSSVPPREKKPPIRSPVFFFTECKSISRYFMPQLLLRLTRGLKWTAGERPFWRIQSASSPLWSFSVSAETPQGTLSHLFYNQHSLSLSLYLHCSQLFFLCSHCFTSAPLHFRSFIYNTAVLLNLILFLSPHCYCSSNTCSIYCITLPSLSQHIVLFLFVFLLPFRSLFP